MGREPGALRLLPIGSGTLKPSDVLEWLADDLPGYLHLCTSGMEKEDKSDCCFAFQTIVFDLAEMSRACARALADEKPVTLLHARYAPGDPDFEEGVRFLAHILAEVEEGTIGSDLPEHVRRAKVALARELEARLALATEGGR